MKTEQIMQRTFLDGIVRQNHKTEMFSVVDLETIGNEIRREQGLKRKQATMYFKTIPAKEHIDQVSIETGIPKEQLVIKKKGKNGGTWVHPLIFLDIAMWFNPRFKVKVLKWLYDNLLLHRDNSGDSFIEMNQALDEAFPDSMKMPYMYPKVSNLIAEACGICDLKRDANRWNNASEYQLKLRNEIQRCIVFASKIAPDLITTIQVAIDEAKKRITI